MSRNIDALIAEHVMGWHKGATGNAHVYYNCHEIYQDLVCAFRPSTGIQAAWKVIEIMWQGDIFGVHKDTHDGWHITGHYGKAEIDSYVGLRFSEQNETSFKETFCKAICLAALKAKGIEHEHK